MILPEMFFGDVDYSQDKHPASKKSDDKHERDHEHCLVTDCYRVNKLSSQQNNNGISNATKMIVDWWSIHSWQPVQRMDILLAWP